MNHRLLLLLLSILSLAPRGGRAQVRAGIKGGFNLTTLSGTVFSVVVPGSVLSAYEPRSSFHAGVYLTAQLSEHWAVQPELLYSGQGNTFTTFPHGNNTPVYTLRMQVINLPLLLRRYQANRHFYLEAGPQLGLLLGATMDQVQDSSQSAVATSIKSRFKSGDYAVAVGLGIEFGRFSVGLRETRGLSDLRRTYSSQGAFGVQRKSGLHHQVLQASIGIRIF